MPVDPSRYDPEVTLREIRRARRVRDDSFRAMAGHADRAAQRMAELWPDPREREIAGLGAVVAAATVGAVAARGGEATMVNLVALLGQSLVDAARAAQRAGAGG